MSLTTGINISVKGIIRGQRTRGHPCDALEMYVVTPEARNSGLVTQGATRVVSEAAIVDRTRNATKLAIEIRESHDHQRAGTARLTFNDDYIFR